MRAVCMALSLALTSVCNAGAPYVLGPVAQPGVQINSFFGAAVDVADTGLGIAGGFNSANAFPFVISAEGVISYLPAIASPSANDIFGSAVAIATPQTSGSLMLIGAFGDDAGLAVTTANRGKVYAYRVQGTNFSSAGELVSPTPTDFGNFGYSVAVQGAFAFVGEVKGKNSNGDVVGAVHIYENTGGSAWVLRTSLFGTQLHGINGRRFGHSIAVSGNSLLIGAPRESDGALLANGAAYVYTGTGANWTLQQRLTSADRNSDDELGTSVAIENNVLVVGSQRDDKAAGNDAGSAYVFTRTGTSWAETIKLTATNAQVRNIFGQSVAINNDEIAVGGYCETGGVAGCPGVGTVEIFKRTGSGSWVSVQSLLGSTGEGFGYVAKFVPGNKALVVSSFRAAPTNAGALQGGRSDGIFANGFE